MTKTIFIIDDDNDFVSLLTEVLAQAGYEVQSASAPNAALQTLRERRFDLVVIDQRMPELTGVELLGQIRRMDTALPVVVVSGFLENASTQEFINLGVAGIFFKPLNIFALLKRVDEVFKGAARSSGASAPDLGIRGFTRAPFSGVSKDVFLKKLQSLASFKGNLLLVGDAGSPFGMVAEEIVKNTGHGDRLLWWTSQFISGAKFSEAIGTAETLTVIIERVEVLTAEEKKAIVQLSKHEAPYSEVPPVRFIFCLTEELDVLYEKGTLDDQFYLFLGNLELKLPKANSTQNLHKPDAVQRAAQNLANSEAKLPGRILVLDDEDLHAQMVVDLIEVAGFKALKLNNPTEGLIALRKERFALVITDFRMPGINGVDFVTQTRQIDPTIPVLVVTGNIQVPEMVRIGNMGITHLIQKPIDNKKFIEEVKGLVRG